MYATTWENFENILLNERSQTHTKKPYTILFHAHKIPRIGKCIEPESRLVVAIG